MQCQFLLNWRGIFVCWRILDIRQPRIGSLFQWGLKMHVVIQELFRILWIQCWIINDFSPWWIVEYWTTRVVGLTKDVLFTLNQLWRCSWFGLWCRGFVTAVVLIRKSSVPRCTWNTNIWLDVKYICIWKELEGGEGFNQVHLRLGTAIPFVSGAPHWVSVGSELG